MFSVPFPQVYKIQELAMFAFTNTLLQTCRAPSLLCAGSLMAFNSCVICNSDKCNSPVLCLYLCWCASTKAFSCRNKNVFSFQNQSVSVFQWTSECEWIFVSKKKLQKCNCRMISSTIAHVCRWYLVPRVLRDVSTVDLSVSVLGEKLSMPLCVAATAMQRMAHPEGETATAKG